MTKKNASGKRVASDDGLCLSVQLYRHRDEGEMWELRMFSGTDFIVDLPARGFEDARRLLKMMGYRITRWYLRPWGAEAKMLRYNAELSGGPGKARNGEKT